MPFTRVRQALYQQSTACWAALLRLGVARGGFRTRERQPWRAGSALIVAPHPDDECLGAGGAARLHRERGDSVTVVVVTDGRASRAVAGAPAARALHRRREAEAACAVLGVTLVWLGLPEGAWDADVARRQLKPHLDGADLLYLPSIVDFHPEHLAVARLLAELVPPRQAVRIYELGVPLAPTLTTMLADTSAVRERVAAALACHDSQRRAWQPLDRRRAYRRALYGTGDVEPFWALSGAAYRRVTAAGAWTWRTTPFRSLRPRPFSDGLAYLRGEQARHALWRAAGGAHV